MKYKVIIREKAEKQLNKLDNSIKLKIMRYIKQNKKIYFRSNVI
ncbi:toxin-antitoxin system, toxin component, RelE domain protein [Leptotrichia wadei]|uniref:Toxin-antitoxin system, toxin component, RelE domain protein n=1 Tax=Leptotrichia wadei TaxID=157687 RepID=A0A134AMX1_9FUSO|nr:toxin-antitoxin system, toxin component, RelE domain protein [Leptotrichia wadei]